MLKGQWYSVSSVRTSGVRATVASSSCSSRNRSASVSARARTSPVRSRRGGTSTTNSPRRLWRSGRRSPRCTRSWGETVEAKLIRAVLISSSLDPTGRNRPLSITRRIAACAGSGADGTGVGPRHVAEEPVRIVRLGQLARAHGDQLPGPSRRGVRLACQRRLPGPDGPEEDEGPLVLRVDPAEPKGVPHRGRQGVEREHGGTVTRSRAAVGASLSLVSGGTVHGWPRRRIVVREGPSPGFRRCGLLSPPSSKMRALSPRRQTISCPWPAGACGGRLPPSNRSTRQQPGIMRILAHRARAPGGTEIVHHTK